MPPTAATRFAPIAVGDTVRYSSDFLKSIGAYTDGLAFIRGEVVSVVPPAAGADYPPLVTFKVPEGCSPSGVMTALASNLQVLTNGTWLPRTLP
jgi:hypothetical protein